MLNDERMRRRQATRDAILDVEREAADLEEDVVTGQHDIEELKKQARAPMPSAPVIVQLPHPSRPSSSPPSSRRKTSHWFGIAAVITALTSGGVVSQCAPGAHGPQPVPVAPPH